MALTLYVAKPSSVRFIGASPPSWMCALLLELKQLEHTIVELDFAAGEHRSPELIALNPRGTIPVLVDYERGRVPVHETFAILEYIEWREPGHLPLDAYARARALTRFHESSELKAAGMRALAYLMRTPEAERDPDQLRADSEALTHELDRWQGYLDGGPSYLGGAEPNLADVAIYPYLATLRQLGLPLARWRALAGHYATFAAHPAAQATRPPDWGEPAPRCPWPL